MIKQEFVMTDDAIPEPVTTSQMKFCSHCKCLTGTRLIKGTCKFCYKYHIENGRPRPAHLFSHMIRDKFVCPHCGMITTELKIGRCHTCYNYKNRTGKDRPQYLIRKPVDCVSCGKNLTQDPHRSRYVCNSCRMRKRNQAKRSKTSEH